MTQEELHRRAVEVAERSRATSALAAEALASQWLTKPNRTHVVENKKEED
ncbi:hypothetical protein [Mycobacteroides abscessus]|nr:hypothetical protein [Mycobacteroides abscessus]EIV25282.1 hypothetical protein MA3A0119R_2672 [Mycobacteroides abscessus 3A-0119-R]EIV29631.1 hypothetical protein MA3A0122R_2735 [Mycobacteroides abscessus 3A-0122-R]EIV36417.1 hypothetical protein MA3A0122S_2290 [Mycobacteroides abscessus 3A-0122-S]EIV38882.1 hypothetical protein MA3A0731_2830 [Mycobacteroides abscessus 3A-0731]EIV53482.1 hypothetical protein MA3A0930S_2700 [Mycobacteroides abscessus 3A-0930-S]